MKNYFLFKCQCHFFFFCIATTNSSLFAFFIARTRKIFRLPIMAIHAILSYKHHSKVFSTGTWSLNFPKILVPLVLIWSLIFSNFGNKAFLIENVYVKSGFCIVYQFCSLFSESLVQVALNFSKM